METRLSTYYISLIGWHLRKAFSYLTRLRFRIPYQFAASDRYSSEDHKVYTEVVLRKLRPTFFYWVETLGRDRAYRLISDPKPLHPKIATHIQAYQNALKTKKK